jgi:hypothetical protein
MGKSVAEAILPAEHVQVAVRRDRAHHRRGRGEIRRVARRRFAIR